MNYQKFFDDEVREKKKALSGVYGRTGKLGFVGAMRYPTDIMSRKEKREYKKNGKVVVTNMYNKLMDFNEFNQLNDAEQKQHLIKWREFFSVNEIKAALNMGNAQYYDLVDRLDVPKSKAKRTPKNKDKKSDKNTNKTLLNTPEPTTNKSGFVLELNGTFAVEEIQAKFEKFGLLVEGEKTKFKVTLKIEGL